MPKRYFKVNNAGMVKGEVTRVRPPTHAVGHATSYRHICTWPQIIIPDVIADPEPGKWQPPAPAIQVEPSEKKGGWRSKRKQQVSWRCAVALHGIAQSHSLAVGHSECSLSMRRLNMQEMLATSEYDPKRN